VKTAIKQNFMKADTSVFAKLQVYGVGSDSFDDSSVITANSKIKSIEIRCGEIIDNIKINYTDGTSSGAHGGNGGSLQVFSLDDDESVTEISGYYGTWWNETVIKQINIITNKKKHSYGSDIYAFSSIPFSIKTSDKYPITGFYGSTSHIQQGVYLTRIGAIILTSDMPDFYKARRNLLIATLYDSVFTGLKDRIEWSAADEKADEKFKELKSRITAQNGYYENPYEATYFNSVSDSIKSTALFGFLQNLPKGAVLHLHPTSMGDYTKLLETAAEYQNDTCQVRFIYNEDGTVVNPINRDGFSFQWKNHPNPGSGLSACAGPYMNLKDVMNDQEQRKHVIDLLVLSPDVMNYDGDMWDLFQPVFLRVGILFKYYPEIIRQFYDDAFEYLANTDHVMHVELRCVWNVNNETIETEPEYLIAEAAKKAGISLKVINFDSRHLKDESVPVSASILQNVVITGNALKNKNNRYLCGYDLVGEEDTGAATAFLLNDFYVAYYQLDKYLPPFFFHDGESDLAPDYDPSGDTNLNDPDTTYFNNNLVDAYLMNTMEFDGFKMKPARVGHGLELFKTPKLAQDYKKADIAIELCPISNQLLRYIKDLREHPGQSYLAAGIPVSLNPDDPAIYNYQGVTYDFWEAVIAWGLDLKMVKVLCYYSLQYSALSESEKADMINAWKSQWNDYIRSVC
jgi:adenosine deaminase CECR1